MDQDHKIWEMSDADFLNFLYQEREREYSKSAAWGINFWVVGAAVIAILGYIFRIIGTVDTLSYYWIFRYLSVLSVILFVLLFIVLFLISRYRWNRIRRITKVWSNIFTLQLFGVFFQSLIISFILSGVEKSIYLVCAWEALSVLECLVILYVSICGDNWILTRYKGRVFTKKYWECAYRILEFGFMGTILILSYYVWFKGEHIRWKELEVSLILIILIGIFYIVAHKIYVNRHRTIDKWIDQYVYGNLSREDAYLHIMAYTQGHDLSYAVRLEYNKFVLFLDKMEVWKEKHTEYKLLINDKKLDYDDCNLYVKVINEEVKQSEQALEAYKTFLVKIKELLVSGALPISENSFDQIMKCIAEDCDKLQDFINDSKSIRIQLHQYLQPFHCRKFGGFCKVQKCTHRDEKPSLRYTIKRKIIILYRSIFYIGRQFYKKFCI